jgi:hypothetical protein
VDLRDSLDNVGKGEIPNFCRYHIYTRIYKFPKSHISLQYTSVIKANTFSRSIHFWTGKRPSFMTLQRSSYLAFRFEFAVPIISISVHKASRVYGGCAQSLLTDWVKQIGSLQLKDGRTITYPAFSVSSSAAWCTLGVRKWNLNVHCSCNVAWTVNRVPSSLWIVCDESEGALMIAVVVVVLCRQLEISWG